MGIKELLERYAEGERNFAGVDLTAQGTREGLKGADLRGINLMGAYFYYIYFIEANLSGACLLGANLSHAVLVNANLSNTNLINANLYRTNLHSANLNRCNLESANLSWARLQNTSLLDAYLSRSNLAYANLTGAKNTNLFQFDGILLWNTTLPDGSIEIGPKYSQ